MPKATVLVVEDESIVSKDIQYSLKKLGYEVIGSSATGAKAIELALELKPNIVLMDIMLKGDINGIEASAEIKKSLNIPIIFLTARNDDKSEAKGLELGAVDYITKPFGVSIVKSRVKIHLELKHVREALENQNAILKIKIKDLEKKISAHDFEGAAKSLTSLTENLEQ